MSTRDYAVIEPDLSVETGSRPKASSPGRQRLFLFLRLLLSFGVLYLLVRKAAFGEILASLRPAVSEWPLLLLALSLPAVGLLLASLRWKTLLAGQGVQAPLLSVFSALLIASFFNQVFPSTVGGDVVRSQRIASLITCSGSRGTGSLLSLAVVALDRALGLLGIVLVAFIAGILSPSLVRQIPEPVTVLALVAVVIACGAVLMRRKVKVAARWLFSLAFLRRVREKAELVYKAWLAYRAQKWRLLIALSYAVLLQITIIVHYIVISSALHLDVSSWGLSVIVPITTVLTLIPISISGIGVRESSLALLGGAFGLTTANAVALAWSVLGYALIYAMLGALLFMCVGHGDTARGRPDLESGFPRKS